MIGYGCPEAIEFFKELDVEEKVEDKKQVIQESLETVDDMLEGKYEEEIIRQVRQIKDIDDSLDSYNLDNPLELALFNSKMHELDLVY